MNLPTMLTTIIMLKSSIAFMAVASELDLSKQQVRILSHSGFYFEELSDVNPETIFEIAIPVTFTMPKFLARRKPTSPKCNQKNFQMCNSVHALQRILSSVHSAYDDFDQIYSFEGVLATRLTKITNSPDLYWWDATPSINSLNGITFTEDNRQSLNYLMLHKTEFSQDPTAVFKRKGRSVNPVKPESTEALKVLMRDERAIGTSIFFGGALGLGRLIYNLVVPKRPSSKTTVVKSLQENTHHSIRSIIEPDFTQSAITAIEGKSLLNMSISFQKLAERSIDAHAKFVEGGPEASMVLMSVADQLSYIAQYTFSDISYTLFLHNIESCLGSKIPIAVVPPSLLRKRLELIKSKLPNTLELAIPVESLMTYYDLKLAGCVFGNEGELLVMNLPLKRRGAEYKVMRVIPIKFNTHESGVCHIDFRKSTIVVDTTTKNAYEVDDGFLQQCVTLGVCSIPMDRNLTSRSSKCVAASYAIQTGHSDKNILELASSNCDIICEDPETADEFVLGATGASSFVLSNTKSDVVISEEGNTIAKFPTDIPFGAIHLQLPCGYEIQVDELVLPANPHFCTETLFSTSIIMPHFMLSTSQLPSLNTSELAGWPNDDTINEFEETFVKEEFHKNANGKTFGTYLRLFWQDVTSQSIFTIFPLIFFAVSNLILNAQIRQLLYNVNIAKSRVYPLKGRPPPKTAAN